MINKDTQIVQQPVITLVPTILQVSINLPTYVPIRFNHQPLDGRQPRDSSRRSSPKGNLPRQPLINPHVGYFGWPTPIPRMLIPPWYQPGVVQLIPKLITKLPYMKL